MSGARQSVRAQGGLGGTWRPMPLPAAERSMAGRCMANRSLVAVQLERLQLVQLAQLDRERGLDPQVAQRHRRHPPRLTSQARPGLWRAGVACSGARGACGGGRACGWRRAGGGGRAAASGGGRYVVCYNPTPPATSGPYR